MRGLHRCHLAVLGVGVHVFRCGFPMISQASPPMGTRQRFIAVASFVVAVRASACLGVCLHAALRAALFEPKKICVTALLETEELPSILVVPMAIQYLWDSDC